MTPTAIRLFFRHAAPSSFVGCWAWRGPIEKKGYGNLSYRVAGTKITRGSHRFAYELFRGPIPEGLHIDHLCRNRACCNPLHLEAVTLTENNRRAVKVRKANNERRRAELGRAA